MKVWPYIDDLPEGHGLYSNLMAAELDRLRKPRIVSNPDILGGTPCIEGHRIPASTIKSFTKAGYSVEQILEEYPTLNAEKIKAAQEWKP